MKFELVHLSSAKELWADQACAVYQEKIKPFVKFEIVDLGSVKGSRENPTQKKKLETEKILKYLKPDDFVVLLDERGQILDNLQWAKKFEAIFNSGKKRCIFIIGGAYGVGEEVQSRANLSLSLSKLVFNHLVAKTVVLEQIYRSFTILKGIPYHNF